MYLTYFANLSAFLLLMTLLHAYFVNVPRGKYDSHSYHVFYFFTECLRVKDYTLLLFWLLPLVLLFFVSPWAGMFWILSMWTGYKLNRKVFTAR